MPRYKMTKEGKFVLVNDIEERVLPVEEPQSILEPVPKPEEEEGEDLSDLFEVPGNQRYEKEDLSDLFEVSEEDVMGEDEEAEEDEGKLEEEEQPHWSDEDVKRYRQSQEPRRIQKPMYRRTAKRYAPPSELLGGMRGL